MERETQLPEEYIHHMLAQIPVLLVMYKTVYNRELTEKQILTAIDERRKELQELDQAREIPVFRPSDPFLFQLMTKQLSPVHHTLDPIPISHAEEHQTEKRRVIMYSALIAFLIASYGAVVQILNSKEYAGVWNPVISPCACIPAAVSMYAIVSYVKNRHEAISAKKKKRE